MEDIQELKNQLAILQEKIERLENEKENIRWRAESRGSYWLLNRSGEVKNYNECNDVTDEYCYKTRNYFKTEKEAKEYREKVNTYYELMDFAEELSRDNPVDWNNLEQRKYYIRYDVEDDFFRQNYVTYCTDMCQIYCIDYNFREKVLAKFGEEKLKKLFI